MFGQYCSFVVNPFKRIQHIRRILSKGFDTFDSSKPLKNIPKNCKNYFTNIEIICCMILFKYMLSYFNMHSLHMDSRQCLCLLHSTAHPFLLELSQSSSSAMNPKKMCCIASKVVAQNFSRPDGQLCSFRSDLWLASTKMLEMFTTAV